MNRFNVYVHYINDRPIYVGSGSGLRYKSKTGRSNEHIALMNSNLFMVKIIHSNLSKEESLNLEQDLYNKIVKDGFTLLNKVAKISKVVSIDIIEICKFLKYDSSSPSGLVWKADRKSGNGKIQSKEGDIAGYRYNDEYYHTKLNNIKYKNHRLIWCLHYGSIPENYVIDHINRDKSDNRIENLRCISQSDNVRNRVTKISNTGYQSISDNLKSKAHCVCWSEDFKSKRKYFTYSAKSGISKEQSFDNALNFRDELVSLNKITLNKDK